jgi:histidinol-phosphate aminotransferase
MTDELERIGLRVTPSAANFLLVHFPEGDGKSARAADTFLHAHRIIVRRVDNYGFPDALRMTIGNEPENHAVLEALSEFMGAA